MDRSLATINEEETDLNTSSSATTGDTLPTVTPKQWSFADTIKKQNRENMALREKILREKIAQLQEELYDTEQALDYNDKDPYGGRTPSQQKPVDPYGGRTPSQQNPVPSSPATYSPHGLTPRVPRPQDLAYQAALQQEAAQETDKALNQADQLQSQEGVLKLFSQLAQALTDNNNADVSTPPHFSGKDDEWETWYSQLRTYLKGKGWLDTFES